MKRASRPLGDIQYTSDALDISKTFFENCFFFSHSTKQREYALFLLFYDFYEIIFFFVR